MEWRLESQATRCHGLRYIFVPKLGSVVRGTPIAHAGPSLSALFTQDELPPVWPDPEGLIRGLSFSPLYRSAPEAARRDIKLHELLAVAQCSRFDSGFGLFNRG